jgi:hypothetical protein
MSPTTPTPTPVPTPTPTPTPTPIPTPTPTPTPGPFLHSCDDCVHFAADHGRCIHGYPTAPHRKNALPIAFCKEFELA